MKKDDVYTERLLITQLKEGNAKAFRKVFDTYRNHVYAYSFSLLKDKLSAEEIVQDVFLKIWLNRFNLNPELSFRSYIFTITKNLTFNSISKASNYKKLKGELSFKTQNSYSPIEDLIHDKEYDRLKQEALNSLPAKRKKVFELSRIEGMSYMEISQELGISIQTVKNHMSKALNNMSDFLKASGEISFLLISFFGIF